jgi:hypothetical protein
MRRHRDRNRILYWFRTPPGVRVGRAALDEDAIRLIEESHPSIRFDWPQILRGDQELPPNPVPPPPVLTPQFDAAAAAAPDEPVSPAHAQLGSEGLARLRARYADVMAGISRRVSEPEQKEQLKASAEQLNPDNWVTADEVRVGLEKYESVFESLRGLIGRRRRRRKSRRSGGRTEGSTLIDSSKNDAASAEEAGAGDSDESAEREEDSDLGSQD